MHQSVILRDYRPGFFRRPRTTDTLSFLVASAVTLAGLGLLAFAADRDVIIQGCGTRAAALSNCLTAETLASPFVALVPFALLGAAALLWRFPILCAFGLLLVATTIETIGEGAPEAFTAHIDIWRNLSSTGLVGIPLSVVEIALVAGLVIWFVKNLFAQTLHAPGSVLLIGYGCYLLFVIAGVFHGRRSGGDVHIALYEIRASFYPPLVLLLGISLIRTRQHVDMLGWLLILGTGFKGMQGAWLYLVTYGRKFTGNSLLDHDEALLFPAYYVFLLLLFVFGGSKAQKWAGLLLLPAVLLADTANKRRASTGALMVCLVLLLLVLFRVMVEHRKLILRGALVGGVVLSLYVGVFWNSTMRIAQPIRAIKSQIAPDERDASSDLYRELENKNVMFAIRHHLIFGQGYGIRMQNVAGMVDLSNVTEMLFYAPHNSILWIWWRLGLAGFAVFWIAMGQAIIRNCMLARSSEDPYIRRWAIFAVVVTVMFLLMAWWDLGMFRYRLVTYTWIMLAVPEVLRRITMSSTSLPENVRTGA